MKLESNGKIIDLSKKVLIMGIVNVTPDSFSGDGNFIDIETTVNQVKKLLDDGADIIDVGGQSTRPGYIEITVEEEINRVVPIIKAISKNFDCLISIDTYRYQVAEECLKNGAHIVNDIWGLQKDNGEMGKIVSKYSAVVIAMHNKKDKNYSEDIIESMKKFYQRTFEIASENKIERNKIIIDPGIGFAKGSKENIEVLLRLEELTSVAPLLLGVSRKKFIGEEMQLSPLERDDGTLGINILAITKGVKIIRVHNVRSHKRGLSIVEKVL